MNFKELDKKYNDFKNAMQKIENIHLQISGIFQNISAMSEEDFAIIKQNLKQDVVKVMNNFEKQNKDFNDEVDMLLKKAGEINELQK